MFSRKLVQQLSREYLRRQYRLQSCSFVANASRTLVAANCQQPLTDLQTRPFHRDHRKTNDSKWFEYGLAFSMFLVGSSFLAWNRDNLSLTLPKAHAFSNDDDDDQSKKKNGRKRYSNMNFIADIVEQVSKSVVYIESQVRHPIFGNAMVNVSSGSGFVVDKRDGVILTNAHVIANTKKVSVKFSDGRVVEGIVEFVDDHLDLATVRIPAQVLANIDVIELGESKRSRAGEWVIAVGAPFSLSNTVTVGVISSLNRAGRELGIHGGIDYIQTDASINIGNSGGPLLNLDGEAIGINTLKVGEGISFAIPSDYAAEFLRKASALRHQHSSSWWGGSRQRPSADPYGQQHNSPVPTRKKYLGLTMITLTPHLIEQYQSRVRDFPDVKSGVLIYRVVLGSPAHLSGIQTGDVVYAINGSEIRRADDVYRVMESSDELLLHIIRKDEKLTLRVKPQIVE